MTSTRDVLDDMLHTVAHLEVQAARLDCRLAPEIREQTLNLRRRIHLAIHREIAKAHGAESR